MKLHLAALSIQYTFCQKPRNRNFASVTFLNLTDGQTFLARHGQSKAQGNRRPARLNNSVVILQFEGKPIYFERSSKKPDRYLIKVLENEEKQRLNTNNAISTRVEPAREKILPITFDCVRVSFGTWKYDSNTSDLLYNSEFRLNVHGTAKFGDKIMVLKLQGGKRIDFKYSNVVEIIAEMGEISSFYISMMVPPNFYEIIDAPVKTLEGTLGTMSLQPISRPTGKQISQIKALFVMISAVLGFFSKNHGIACKNDFGINHLFSTSHIRQSLT